MPATLKAQQEARDRGHILVVDDDRLILATLSGGLRQAGFRVTEAGTGADALRLAKEVAPDLALLDVRLPDISGIDVAAQLALSHDIPFLFLSAYGDAEIVGQANGFGALGYLVKPLDVSQIVPSIEAALARAKDIGALRERGAQLTRALESRRETSMAVGILMERRGLSRREAFDALRTGARSQRRPLKEVAVELVTALETLHGPPPAVPPKP
jgi:AmiR/NasT family two-component response regulator